MSQTYDKYFNSELQWIDYNGKFPNLCNGVLVLKYKNKLYKFGYLQEYDICWQTEGTVYSTENGHYYTEKGKWIIYESQLPKELKSFKKVIEVLFNTYVPQGCCGGCI